MVNVDAARARLAANTELHELEDRAGGVLAVGGVMSSTFGSVYRLSVPMGQFYRENNPYTTVEALYWCNDMQECVGMKWLK